MDSIPEDVKIWRPKHFKDRRGFTLENWNMREFHQLGIKTSFVQDNQSFSNHPGTLRGLHFQQPPFAQAKLVRCSRGKIFDVVVDIREESPSYLKWFGVELSYINGLQIFIPEGFLHGFVTLEPDTEIIYKCSNYYQPSHQCSIRFDDPQLAINWPIPIRNDLLSNMDSDAILIRDLNTPFRKK